MSTNLLLEQIRREGWTQSLAEEFEARYADILCVRITLHMNRLRVTSSRVHPEWVSRLPDRQLEIYQDSLSDLWEELMKGLVDRYLHGVETGRIQQEFVAYVSGVLRHIVIRNARKLGLLPPESPLELLRSICKAKETSQQKIRISWAKYCLADWVRSEVASLCSHRQFDESHRSLHRVVDYVFEKYIPNRCDLIARHGRRAMDILLRQFVEGDEFAWSVRYAGDVIPRPVKGPTHAPVSLDEIQGRSSPDLSEAAIGSGGSACSIESLLVRDERTQLWDAVLRGRSVGPEHAEAELMRLARASSSDDKAACTILVAVLNLLSSPSQVVRRNLRAALRYWFSRLGTKARPGGFDPSTDLEGAGLEEISGLYLTWPEAMLSVGANPLDYSALQRATEALRVEFVRLWTRSFGSCPTWQVQRGDA